MFQIKSYVKPKKGGCVAKNCFAFKNWVQIIKGHRRITLRMLLSILLVRHRLLYFNLNSPPVQTWLEIINWQAQRQVFLRDIEAHHPHQQLQQNSPALNCLQDSLINRDGCVLYGELWALLNLKTWGPASIDQPHNWEQSRSVATCVATFVAATTSAAVSTPPRVGMPMFHRTATFFLAVAADTIVSIRCCVAR